MKTWTPRSCGASTTETILFLSPTVVCPRTRSCLRHRPSHLAVQRTNAVQRNDEQPTNSHPVARMDEMKGSDHKTSDSARSPLRLLQPLNVNDGEGLRPETSDTPVRSAVEVSAELRKIILMLYGQHITEDGRKVNYKALAKDPAFQRYVESTAELQRVKVGPSHMNREESLCFWMNTYNALVVHATVVAGAPQNNIQRLKFFGNASYLIDGQRFSLDDIEHGILRGNAPKPTNLFSILGLSFLAPKTFSDAQDPRRKLSISPVDPRIHFALNCGATSCPPIRVYTPDRLELGLKAAASSFCATEVSVDEADSAIIMSSILKWYGKDFGSKADLIEFLRKNVTDETKSALDRVIERVGSDVNRIRFKYKPYDWGVNEAE